ncbi:MAG TPA: hypothetical protein VE398_21570 [Acidobacteriota bacterium]|nr:hypothetical protein [Acidobacteriota bacterium]
MLKFTVVWKVELKSVVEADSEKQAIDKIEDRDPVDGEYVEDSFDIVQVEEIE